MNHLAHILLTYSIISVFFEHSREYFIPIAVFSIILDIDHIPGMFMVLRMQKEKADRLRIDDFVSLMRTSLQEPIGIVTIITMFSFLYIFGLRHVLLILAGASLLLHWIIDFLTVHTRPLMPLNKKVVSLFFRTKKQRYISELVITALSVVFFILLTLS